MNWKRTCQTTIEWFGHACPVWWLPWFDKKLHLKHDRNTNPMAHFDIRFHLLATFLASYPTADTAKLAKEFGLNGEYAKQLANFYGVHKDAEKRREICQRNGDNPKSRRYFWAVKKRMVKQDTDE